MKKVIKLGFLILVSACVLAVVVQGMNLAPRKAHAGIVGSGTEASPYLITSVQDFSDLMPLMTVQGTIATPWYFRIENNINMNGLVSSIPTLANHIVVDGQGYVLSNLNSSLFGNVIGPNTVIKNISFTGTGNIARNFCGILDNVHHTSGIVMNLNATSVGGLVNFSKDATFRYCSNNANVQRSSGSAADVNGGIIGVANGNLRMIRTTNSGQILTMGTVEASGGLVGKIANNDGETATIELCENKASGLVNGQRSGGLVGKKEGAGKLEIKESLNLANIFNRSDPPAECAGILAYATGGSVTIESCYNRGTVRIGEAPSNLSGVTMTSNSSGIFSTNSGATVSIKGCYSAPVTVASTAVNYPISFATSGVTASSNFALSGTYTTLGNCTQVIQADLRNISTVNSMNGVLALDAYRLPGSDSINDGYPVHIGLTTTTYIFDANGGLINGAETSKRLNSFAPGHDDIVSVTRKGFDFKGWNTNAQATSTSPYTYLNYWDVPLGESYYAVWQATPYTVSFTDSVSGNQQYALLDENNLAIFPQTVIIGQKVYLQTWLTSMGSWHFIDWEIKNDAGVFVNAPGIRKQEIGLENLELFESGASLIDETFLDNYAIGGIIAFRGVYSSIIPLNLYIQTDNPSWGTVKVDGVPFGLPQPPKKLVPPVSVNTLIYAEPKEHYRFVEFKIGMHGGPLTSYAGTATGSGYSHTIPSTAFTNDLDCQVVFAPIAYNIVVTARNAADNSLISGSAAALLVKGTAPATVSLGGPTFSGITLASSAEYKLINESQNNIKILNYPNSIDPEFKGDPYDKRWALGGVVNIPINASFLSNYWNPSTNTIEIIAIYTKLVRLEINVTEPDDVGEIGNVILFVRDGSFQDTRELTGFNGMSYGYGSNVAMEINPFPKASVVSIYKSDSHGVQKIFDVATDSGGPPDTVNFTLTEDVSYAVKFGLCSYTMEVVVTDANGDRYYEGQEITKSFNLDIYTQFNQWRGEGLAEGDIISIEKGTGWENEWGFVEWRLVYTTDAGTGETDFEVLEPDALSGNLVGDYAIKLDDNPSGFAKTFLTESTHFVIEARFKKRFSLNVQIQIANSIRDADSNVATVTGSDGALKPSYEKDKSVLVKIEVKQFYEFIGISGLHENDETETVSYKGLVGKTKLYEVTVTMDENRSLTINVKPEETIIDNSKDTATNGKIDLLTTHVGIGKDVAIQFTVNFGFQRSSWEINGESIDKIKENYGSDGITDIKISGNTITLTVGPKWLEKWGGELNSNVKTELNTFIIVAIIIAALLIPALIIGIIMMIRANKRRKAEYLVALKKMKEAKARFGHVDLIKRLREE